MNSRKPLGPDLADECRDRLGPDRADLFDQLISEDPARLMAAIREDRDFGVGLIECETTTRLGPLFSDDPGTWTWEPERSGPLGESSFGVSWAFTTTHDDTHGRFNGIPPTGREVTVRGYTILGFDPERGVILVRRWVDWMAVLAQLGLTVNWRIPVPTGAPPSGATEDEPPASA